MEARNGTFVVKDEDDDDDEEEEAFNNCPPRRDDRKMREEDNRRKEDIFAFWFYSLCIALAGRRFYRSGRLLVTYEGSPRCSKWMEGKNREKKIRKKSKKCGVACYLAGGALASSSSSLHSSISRFDELLLGAAFAVVAVTVFNYYCWY